MMPPSLRGVVRPVLGAMAAVVAVAVAVRLYDVAIHWGEWGFRRALPSSATDVHDAAWEDGLLPDYEYCLQARVTEAEFQAYARRFHLTPVTPDRTYEDDEGSWLGWHCPPEATWWSSPPEVQRVHQRGTTWTMAAYHDGTLYLSSIHH